MTFKQRALKALAACAIASLVAGCGGGGGSHAFVPGTPSGGGGGSTNTPQSNAVMTATLPTAQSGQSRKPKYLSNQGTSSIVVSVNPSDPAEASVWASTYGVTGFTLCYNIFTQATPGGPTTVASPLAPGVTVTAGPPATVSFPFPAPPGQDTFIVSQYAGACASQYAAPVPPTGETAAQLIISQSTPLVANMVAGGSNTFSTQLGLCGVYPAATGTCAVPGVGAPITPTLGASVSFAYMAASNAVLPFTLPAAIPLPIAGPMREQSVFTSVAANRVGFPIPIVGLDGSGHAIPFTAGAPPSSGLLPHGANNTACTTAVPLPTGGCADNITLTLAETDVSGSNHFTIELVDAATGAVAQNPGTTVTLTQLNALNCPTDCPNGGVNGDKYVVLGLFDGSSAAASTSAKLTLNATISGTAITPQTLTITPQASLFTAVAAGPTGGYTDVSAPYASASDILNIPTTVTNVAAAGQGYWVDDGNKMHRVGNATVTTLAEATTLTGMTLDNNANLTLAGGGGYILAADNAVTANAGSAAPVKSGVVAFNPATPATHNAMAIQDLTTGNYVAFGATQAIAFVSGGYVYVFAGNKIYAIDPQSNGIGGLAQVTASAVTYDIAEEIGTLPVSGLNSGTDTGFDVVATGTKLTFADTGNNRIAQIDTATCQVGGAACTPTVIASGHPFVGLSVNGTGFVATDTAGQIYTITSTGTVTSLGLSNASTPKDGVVGVIGTSPLAPIPYTPQGQATGFFGSATPTLPYNILPFTAAGPVFTAVPANIVADTSNGTFGSTAGVTTSGFGIAFIPTAPAPATTALTAGSYLFTDKGALRTLVP